MKADGAPPAMPEPLHLIKLCVGCDSVDELLEWRAAEPARPWILRTRQTPRRATELEGGGSLYRVFKGVILSRQRILRVTCVGEGAAARCEIALDEAVILTVPTPRHAFQGWRYLLAQEAPADLGAVADGAGIPPELSRKLLEAGVW
jgi:hypothetical protein